MVGKIRVLCFCRGETMKHSWWRWVLSYGLLVSVGCGKTPTKSEPTGETPRVSRKQSESAESGKSPAPANTGWSSEWSQVGDVRVRVDRIAVQKPMVLSASGKPYQDQFEHLVVWVTIENLSASEPLEFPRWEFGNAGLKVTDEQGKSYDSRSFSTVHPKGGITDGKVTIAPGKTQKDVLLFQPPDAGAGKLQLTLPARAGDGTALHEFQIPNAAWKN